jgi:hypothetical protein
MMKFIKRILDLLFKRDVSLHREEKVNIYYIYYNDIDIYYIFYIDLSNKK